MSTRIVFGICTLSIFGVMKELREWVQESCGPCCVKMQCSWGRGGKRLKEASPHTPTIMHSSESDKNIKIHRMWNQRSSRTPIFSTHFLLYFFFKSWKQLTPCPFPCHSFLAFVFSRGKKKFLLFFFSISFCTWFFSFFPPLQWATKA